MANGVGEAKPSGYFRDEETGRVGWRAPELSLVQPIPRELTLDDLKWLATQKLCGNCKHFRDPRDDREWRAVRSSVMAQAADAGFGDRFWAMDVEHRGVCGEKSSGVRTGRSLYLTGRMSSADTCADYRARETGRK